jgi:hypothetical protein
MAFAETTCIVACAPVAIRIETFWLEGVMTRATAGYAALLGIDWADCKHDLCLPLARPAAMPRAMC